VLRVCFLPFDAPCVVGSWILLIDAWPMLARQSLGVMMLAFGVMFDVCMTFKTTTVIPHCT